jgi:hypothetical protein
MSAALRRLPVLRPRRPATRGDCIAGTDLTGSRDERMTGRAQCGAYDCRHNLSVVESESVPGRRHGGLAPEWTVTDRGDAGAPSCCLDVADTGPHTPAEIARYLGTSKRRVEQIIKAALEGEGGVELARLESALLGSEDS